MNPMDLQARAEEASELLAELLEDGCAELLDRLSETPE